MGFARFGIALALAFAALPSALADPFEIERSHASSLSRDLGFGAALGANAEGNGVWAEITALFFGKNRALLEAASRSTDLLEGESAFTVAGLRVWSGKGEFKDGAYVYRFGVPTTRMRVPLAAIPVGPLVLHADAGIAFEGGLEGSLAPQLVIPIEFAGLRASLATRASAAGFIEGYAHFLFLRGGVGGQVDLVHGKAEVGAALSAQARTLSYSGFFEFLAGRFYAFADYFRIWTGSWKRFLNLTLYRWKGACLEIDPARPDAESTCGN